MSVNNFIPEIWSAAMLEPFQKALVAGNLVNRDYEGDIRGAGDTVRISEIGDILISDYTKNSTTAITIQELNDAQTRLVINKAKYYNFYVDDVDKAQASPKIMPKAMERAAYNMADQVDQDIITAMSTTGAFFQGWNSTELGSTTTALSVTSTAVFNALSWYQRIFDQNNVPNKGRWLIVSPAIAQQMVIARIISDTMGASKTLEGGATAIGEYYGMKIYMSNNVYLGSVASSQYHCIGGHSMGVTYAGQLTTVEAFRPEQGFKDAIKGLYVYGTKVIRPNCILKGVFTP